jgi:hypothetical protein
MMLIVKVNVNVFVLVKLPQTINVKINLILKTLTVVLSYNYLIEAPR